MYSAACSEGTRILYVINHLEWFWSHRLPLALAARDLGWDVVVAAPGAKADTQLKSYKLRGAEVGSTGRRHPLLSFIRTILQIRRLLKKERPSIVHVVTLKSALPAALAARDFAETTVIVTIAGLGYLFCSRDIKAKVARQILRPLLAYAFKRKNVWIIFQNQSDRSALANSGALLPQQSIVIGGSGVSLRDFPYIPEPALSPPVVLMACRMVRDKGIAVYIEAARLANTACRCAHFLLAGGIDDGNPSALTVAEVRSLVADGSVEWCGHVSDIARLYGRCAIFVYPSYYGEGVPKVLLEAAAIGRPIVTTDHPGCRDVVTHMVNGLLVPIKDAKALADAVSGLLADGELRAAMGKRSRERAVEEFDVRLIVAKTVAFYEHALKARPALPNSVELQ